MMNNALTRREIRLLILLFAVNAIFYLFVIEIGIPDPDGFGISQGLPPSFTARVTVILIGLILALRLIQLMLNPAAAEVEDSKSVSEAVSTKSELGLRNTAGIACALAFAFVLVPVIGYYLASVIMILVLMWVMGEKRWHQNIFQSTVVVGLIWLLFDQVFSIQLPLGRLIGG